MAADFHQEVLQKLTDNLTMMYRMERFGITQKKKQITNNGPEYAYRYTSFNNC